MRSVQCLLLVALLLWQASASPVPAVLNHDGSAHAPLATVSELTSRVASRSPRLGKDARLPLPTPQEIEAIKKVAQILAMLGEQVIPAIIGDPAGPAGPAGPATGAGACDLGEDEPNDPVNDN